MPLTPALFKGQPYNQNFNWKKEEFGNLWRLFGCHNYWGDLLAAGRGQVQYTIVPVEKHCGYKLSEPWQQYTVGKVGDG